MKRKIFAQMRAEWRGNLWMVVEFTIISVVLWYSISFLLSCAQMYKPSEGYDFTDVYVAEIRWVQPDSPKYTEYGDGEEAMSLYLNDVNTLLTQINNNPYVETAGKGRNGIPFSFNFNGHQISRASENGDTLLYRYHFRAYDSNAVKALRIRGSKGETTEQIAEYINKGQAIISEYDKHVEPKEDCVPPDSFLNRTLPFGQDQIHIAPMTVNFLRRVDYEANDWSGVLLYPLEGNNLFFPSEIIIRIKPGTDLLFKESLANSTQRIGNAYMSDLQSVADIRDNAQKQFEIEILKQVSAITFLLLLVFLGLLGTYWFRTQERVPEIAIRKVAGARNGDIFRRLLAEGFILMGVSVAIAMIFIMLIIKKELLNTLAKTGFPEYIYYYGIIPTMAVLALTVLAGIYFPARRAMKINPATALKDQ